MEYISTRNKKEIYSFKDVFLKGLAPDGGLFIPKEIPFYNHKDLKDLKNLSYNELATKIILKFCSEEFNEDEIKEIVKKSYKNFRVKDTVCIKKLEEVNLLELFHGPTLAFKDIAPVAPVHVLIVPKKEISCIQSISEQDLSLIGEIVKVAQEIAKDMGIEENYRLLTNNGTDAGQTVFHLHFHLIGGRPLGAMA